MPPLPPEVKKQMIAEQPSCLTQELGDKKQETDCSGRHKHYLYLAVVLAERD